MRYFIGVDGGGTKTAFALFNENKKMIESCEGRASNHENMSGSFPEAASVIMDGICELLKLADLKLDDVTGTLMGLAGIDHEFQHEAICGELKKRGLKNFYVYNDGFIVIKAGVGKGAGIGYNCGTGTCCNSIDSRGQMLQVGGFSELSGDEGNGHWIAAQAFRIVYDELCLGKDESLVTRYVAEKSEIRDRATLLASIMKLEGPSAESYIRLFIVAFFEAANQGDKAAGAVIEEMAQRGADFISAHVKKMQFDEETINVVLSGSIHTKLPSDLYIDRMRALVTAQSGHKFNFIKLSVPPVTGCVNWLLELS